MALTDHVIGEEGEGVMVKDPESRYETKRSWSLLKVKRFDDSEAIVIDHEAGRGRLEGVCGALKVKEPTTGHEFKMGSGFSDE